MDSRLRGNDRGATHCAITVTFLPNGVAQAVAFLDRRSGHARCLHGRAGSTGDNAGQIHALVSATLAAVFGKAGTIAAAQGKRGSRAGMQEVRSTGQAARSRHRFLADAMLGRLARWLRILGYDTAYERVIADDELIRRVLQEDRWLLTRDRYLARRRVLRARLTLLQHDDVLGQLRELASARGLDLTLGPGTASRGADCNAPLTSMPKERVVGEVPPAVAVEQEEFARCPQCGRLFWPGRHWQRLTRDLERLRGSSGRSDC